VSVPFLFLKASYESMRRYIWGSRPVKAVLLCTGVFCLVITCVVFMSRSAKAASGINKQISFQGKVVAKADGTNVTDGNYTFTFRIYSSSTGSTGSPCASACIWEETKTLTVTSGIFQTNLGDTTALPGAVDFNSDSLYLSVKFNGDTEMSPRIRLAAVPYAFNADKLGGLSASQYAQLSPGSQQTGSLNVSGSITSGSSILSGTFDTASATALNLGTASATSILIGKSSTATLIKGNANIGTVANISAAGHLFSDGFESGNTKLWDRGTSVSGSSSLATNAATVHNGKYSAKVVAAGAVGNAKASIAGAATTMLRSYINVSSYTGDLGLMELDTTTSTPAHSFQLYVNGGNGKLAFYDDASGTFADTTYTFTTNVWHEVELDLTIGSSTGSIKVYVDGADVTPATTFPNTGTVNPNQVTLGATTADTGTAYFDDLVVDTVRPSDGASLGVADSLHVSGSSSFGGLALFQGGSNSTAAFQIQNTAGTSSTLVADTVNNRIGIAMAPSTNTLDVGGAIGATTNITVGGAYQINGNNVLSYFSNYNILRSASSSGGLQIWNAANSSAIATLTDAGGLAVSSYLSANTLQTASGDLTVNPVGNTKITGSTADSSTIALSVTDSSGTNGLLQVRNDGVVAIGSQYGIDANAGPGDLAVDGSFWSGGNQGITGGCQAGTALTGTQVVGGIITGGNCAGVSTSLQDVYTSSSTGGSAPSTPALVRQGTTNSSGTSSFVASVTTTAGDLLVLSASPNNANYWITSITDDAGDTWKEVGSAHGAIGSNGSYSRAQMWYTYNTARTGVTNLTITLNGSVQVALNFSEYSGIATTSDPLDGASNKATGNVGTVTSPSLTTGNDNDLYVADFGWNTTPTVSSHTWNSLTQSNVGTSHSLATSYTSGSAGTYQASWTMSANVNVGTVIGAFKANTGTSTIARIKLDGSKDLAIRTSSSNPEITFSNTTGTVVIGSGDTTSSSDPAAGVNGAMYYNATLNKMRCYINGLWTNCSGTPYFPDRHWGLTSQNTATPGLFTGTSQSGDIGALSYTTGNGNASVDTSQAEDSYLVAPTTSTNGNSLALTTSDGTEERWRPYFTTRIRVSNTGSERIFVGMSTNTAGSMTDTPTTASWVGFRYSTSASDTTWKCGSGDGSASSYSAIGSLPAISASAYYDMTIDWTTSGQIVCTVRVSGGTGYSVTKTTNLPTGSTVLNYFTQLTTLTAAVRQIEQAYIYIERN